MRRVMLLHTLRMHASHRPHRTPLNPAVAIGWDENAGLRTECGVRSQVIDVLRGTRDEGKPATKTVSTAVSQQSRILSQPTKTIAVYLGDRNSWYCVLDGAARSNAGSAFIRPQKRCSKLSAPFRAAGSLWRPERIPLGSAVRQAFLSPSVPAITNSKAEGLK